MRKFPLIPHQEHIIQFVASIERPSPQLILEYLPLGNLQSLHAQRPITDQESLAILCQNLDALTSVHEQGIVHRDIKPENILVQSRDPLHIKLSEFGLSKATADLQMFCGTLLYAAPEIYQNPRVTYYTNVVDFWSLGVVVFQYAYGLPDFHNGNGGLYWCKKIISQLTDWDPDILLDFLSNAMLTIKPERRLSAKDCWVQALQLSVPSENRCPTPTQASYNLDQHQFSHKAEEQRAVGEVIGSTQTTIDHYLIDYNTEEQVVEDLVTPTWTERLSTSFLRRSANSSEAETIECDLTSISNRSSRDQRLAPTQIWNLLPDNTTDPESYERPILLPKSSIRDSSCGKRESKRPRMTGSEKKGKSNIVYSNPPSVDDISSSRIVSFTFRGLKEDVGYIRLRVGTLDECRHVIIRRADFGINATHISQVAGHNMKEVQKYLQSQDIPRDIMYYQTQFPGTYIDLGFGIELCQKYRLIELKRLIQQVCKQYQRSLPSIKDLAREILPGVYLLETLGI